MLPSPLQEEARLSESPAAVDHRKPASRDTHQSIEPRKLFRPVEEPHGLCVSA